MDFTGKRVLVTGAGKGIGRTTCQQLAGRGAQVIAWSRDPSDLASLANDTGCETLCADLGDAEAALDHAARALPVDMLVNCAGIVRVAPFLETTLQDFHDTLNTNTVAPMLISQVVARDWVARNVGGTIVNVSSIAAHFGTPNHAAYCASKAALDALTRVMAVELGPLGIRTNSVNPVVTLSPMGIKTWSDPQRAGPMLQRIPLQRFAEPEDVASAILFLLSDEARMVNGVCLDVDGGFCAS